MATNWLNPEEARAWRGYRRMFLLLNARLARELAADSGLSEPDYDVLSALSSADRHRARITVLAGRMLWSHSRLSHHLARMQQRGLVVRTGSDEDGRGSYIAITEAGMRAIESAAPGHVAAVRRFMIDRLTPEQIKVLGDITEIVVDGLTEPDADASRMNSC